MKKLLFIAPFLLLITGCDNTSKIEKSVEKISKNIEYLTEKEKANDKSLEKKVSTNKISTRVQRDNFLQPASRLKDLSEKNTKLVRKDFISNRKTRRAYQEVKKFIAEQLTQLAEEGFYNTINITITDLKNKTFLYNSLTDRNKDILETLLKEDLITLGYSVKSSKYDSNGLDWVISWN